LGLGPGHRWYEAASPTSDAAVTIFPLPMYGTSPGGGIPAQTTTTTTQSTTTTETETPRGHGKKGGKKP
jgi:hypothetical protein